MGSKVHFPIRRKSRTGRSVSVTDSIIRNGIKRCPTRWGQSAGSISVMLQMVAYDGQLDGLFQGAVMVRFNKRAI